MRKLRNKIQVEAIKKRSRRQLAIRKKVIGDATRPRLCASKSNRNLFVQVIDDQAGKTLFSVQSFGKNAPQDGSKSVAGAKVIGSHLAAKLKEKGIEQAVFDRNGRKYTGVLHALAESLREQGIRV